jgi:hypothetical protein
MKKCIVIMQPSVYDLEQSANKMLNNGWIPLGGIAVRSDGSVPRCFLAMLHENWKEDQTGEEKTIVGVLHKLIDLIDDAADHNGDLGSAFTPEYQAAYKKACWLLNREEHEMLV